MGLRADPWPILGDCATNHTQGPGKGRYTTRLETRTKESNIYASVLVEKPTRVMKVTDANPQGGSIDRP